MAKPDYADVFRKAHELRSTHGWNAHSYAARQAAEALADGNVEESEFWKAVEAALKPRLQTPE